jgi:hypothetical protein
VDPTNDPIDNPVVTVDDEPNQMAATIDGTDWVIYQADSLNEPSENDLTFFEFGRMITTNEQKSDTCMVIHAGINHRSIRLVFPFPKDTGSFDILQYNNLLQHPSAWYQPDGLTVEGKYSEVFYTQQIIGDPNLVPVKAGSITITRFDFNKQLISGTFYFKATGYYIDSDYRFQLSNRTANITNGRFIYHWDNLFDEE